jgi:hypothetical protein
MNWYNDSGQKKVHYHFLWRKKKWDDPKEEQTALTVKNLR